MKKWIALFMALVMTLGLAACASKTEAPAQTGDKASTDAEEPVQTEQQTQEDQALIYEGVKLTVSMAPLKSADTDMAFWNEHLKAFAEQTGAEIEVTINDWTELQPKYLTSFMSGNAYDVMYAWPSMLPEFIDAGFVEPLDEYYSDQEIADEYFWSNCTYKDGKTYGVGFYGGTGYRCYVYNMDVLNECGVTELPTTWTELLDVCEKIHSARPDLYTFLGPLAGNSRCVDSMILAFNAQAGGTMMNEDQTAMTFNTPEMKRAFEFELELMNNGYLSEDALGLSSENVVALFNEGKAAIAVSQSPEVYFADADFEWAASTQMRDVKDASFNATDILCVNASSANVQAAVDLVKYINSNEMRTAINAEFGQSAKLRASDNEPVVDPRVADVWAHPERAFTTPMAKTPASWTDTLTSVQQLILSGAVSVDQGLEDLQAALDAAMAE